MLDYQIGITGMSSELLAFWLLLVFGGLAALGIGLVLLRAMFRSYLHALDTGFADSFLVFMWRVFVALVFSMVMLILAGLMYLGYGKDAAQKFWQKFRWD